MWYSNLFFFTYLESRKGYFLIKKNISIIIKDLGKELIVYDYIEDLINKLAAFRCNIYKIIKKLTQHFLSDPMFLKFSVFILKNSKGVHYNIKKINVLQFRVISDLIKSGVYVFGGLHTLKTFEYLPGCVTKNCFTMQNIWDKILQQAITILLEIIYEKNHTAIKDSGLVKWNINFHLVLHHIKFTWACLPYYIEIKIGQCFTKIHCQILINILKKKICDKFFFDLIWRMYKYSFLCPEGFYLLRKEKKLQSNKFSFLICNLFLNELDIFITKQIMFKFQKKVFNHNTPYHLQSFVLKNHRKARVNFQLLVNNSNINLKYIRYMDSLLLGINSSYRIVFFIKKSICFYLQSNFHLNLKMCLIKIVNTYCNKVKFLGVLIYNQNLDKLFSKKSSLLENAIRVLKKNKIGKKNLIQKIKLNTCFNFLNLLERFNVYNFNYFNMFTYQNLISSIIPLIKKQKIDRNFNSNLLSNPIWFHYIVFLKILSKNLIQYIWFFYRGFDKKKMWFIKCFNFGLYIYNFEFADIYYCSSFKLVLSTFIKLFNFINNWVYIQYLFIQQFIKHTSNILFRQNRFINILPNIICDVKQVYIDLIRLGILNLKIKAICNLQMVSKSDYNLVLYYNNLAVFLLNYFRCVDNFYRIQNIINWFLRFSLLLTIRYKHRLLNTKAVLKKYGVLLNVSTLSGISIHFLTTESIFRLKKIYLLRSELFSFFN